MPHGSLTFAGQRHRRVPPRQPSTHVGDPRSGPSKEGYIRVRYGGGSALRQKGNKRTYEGVLNDSINGVIVSPARVWF